MQDLIMALDNKESEINAYMAETQKEREHLINRLNELDIAQQGADRDLRRINKARNALRNPDENEMMARDISEMAVAVPTMAKTQQMYRPE